MAACIPDLRKTPRPGRKGHRLPRFSRYCNQETYQQQDLTIETSVEAGCGYFTVMVGLWVLFRKNQDEQAVSVPVFPA